MSSDVITPAERREKVVHEIFWNLVDIQKVNSRLASALIDRREKQDVIDTIGDILLSFICEFEPYIAYGAHQVVGKHYFELEKIRNNRFAHFVEVRHASLMRMKRMGLSYVCEYRKLNENQSPGDWN